jgi:Cu(I)/Ag(I) efflux system membrane fusion protein
MREAGRQRLALLGLDRQAIEAIAPDRAVPQSIALRAPAAGVVIQKSVRTGGAFASGEMLYTIADLSHLWVEVEIYQHDLQVLDRIEKATVFLGGHGRYEARILDRSPLLDEASQSVTLRLGLDNPEGRLQPGLFARVRLLEPEETILFLPTSAVMPRGDEYYVFAEGFFEGEYEPRAVGARRIGREGYAIEWGLEPGEKVVSDALFLFDSDAEINMLY